MTVINVLFFMSVQYKAYYVCIKECKKKPRVVDTNTT